MALYGRNTHFNRYIPKKKTAVSRETHVTEDHKTLIYSIANQKGGVGKTTTAINLSTSMAAIGKNVLLIDLDPQGNATTGLGVSKNGAKGIYHVLFEDAEISDVEQKTQVPNLQVISSTVHLSSADLELVNMKEREYRLKKALEKRQKLENSIRYDYVFVDCPPSLNLVTINALVASTAVLVPLQCEFFALEGLSQLTHTIDRIRRTFNPNLELEGVVLTMYDPRNNLSHSVSDDVRRYFGSKVFDTIIPRNVRISEAPSHGLPALIYDMKCSGSRAYMELARELLKRIKDRAISKNQMNTVLNAA